MSVYTAPWYAAWVLPVLALRWRSRLTWWAFGFFAVLVVDDRTAARSFPQVLRLQTNFGVRLGVWLNTLAMLSAVAVAALLVIDSLRAFRTRADAARATRPRAPSAPFWRR